MLHTHHFSSSGRQNGVILMVVLAMLTLFAIVGVGFVYYADSAAKSALLTREAETAQKADVEAEMLLTYFLGQFLYDADDVSGVGSALRGHSLARSMYGLNGTIVAGANGGFVFTPGTNNVPFNGTGRAHFTYTSGAFNQQDDYNLVNYTYFRNDAFVRDPERIGARTSPQQPYTASWFGGYNAPYTYPDANNMYLAAVKADGTVLIPSFHRDWLGFGPLGPTNPNWLVPSAQDPSLKYKVLRPRPIDHIYNGQMKFPLPADSTGDVKNLVGAPGGNDSIWIDLGFPVMTAPNGQKYKPLFAPLIIDLDNRVNVNVHGNIRGRDTNNQYTHASHQGWGPWEVNLGQVLSYPSQPPEWTNLFAGSPSPYTIGRYGLNFLPGPGGALALSGTWPRYYGQADYDACQTTNGYQASTGLLLAGQPGNPNPVYSVFPYFDAATFANGDQRERTDHPLLSNVFNPLYNYAPSIPGQSEDRVFAISNMEALLRTFDTGFESMTSELTALLPGNLAQFRTRNLITTRSFDYARPGATPWLLNPAANPLSLNYPQSSYPTGPFIGSPQPPVPPTPFTPNGEFGADGRSLSAGYGRVDLNRRLPDFPPPMKNTPPYRWDLQNAATLQAYTAAITARQQMARDIYLRLRLVTTGTVTDPQPPPAITKQEYDAYRWLAQLAVNIVDYIDEDDYNTPFNWNPTTNTSPGGIVQIVQNGWVFGTELPRVVLNEVYAELTNNPGNPMGNNPGVGGNFDLHLWFELHTPFSADPILRSPVEDGVVRLQRPNMQVEPIYQLMVRMNPNDQQYRAPENVLGEPAMAGGTPVTSVSDFTMAVNPPPPAPPITFDANVIQPNNNKYNAGSPGATVFGTNIDGFYVIGSPADFPGTSGTAFATSRLDALKVADAYDPGNIETQPLGAYLQRLANPYLPRDDNPLSAFYNPFITVDYVSDFRANLAVGMVRGMPPMNPIAIVNRDAYGRNQPFAGHVSQLVKQDPTNRNPQGTPKHTFFQVNATEPPPGPPQPKPINPQQTLVVPYDWLTHLDRQVTSPMELLHVSAFKPHELTQQFVTGTTNNPVKFTHNFATQGAFDQTSRLFRLFEFIETRNRSLDMVTGGRTPGKININTIWDPETFMAVVDPQAANYFTQAYQTAGVPFFNPNPMNPYDPTTLFGMLIRSRTKTISPTNVPIIGPSDQPFWGLAAPIVAQGDLQYPLPYYPNGTGIDNTLLRSAVPGGGPQSPRLLEVPGPALHPYHKYELLSKTFNHFTTRSNVFAVWITVGFFEVLDDTKQPPILGAEIGKSENRHVRHRMFSIVDRTNLRLQNTPGVMPPPPVFIPAMSGVVVPTPPPMGGVPVSVTVTSLSGRYEDTPWQLLPGTQLLVDPGPNQELVTISANPPPANNTFTANFTKSHSEGFLILLNALPGNPGPQPRYNYRNDPAVVPYFSIIQ